MGTAYFGRSYIINRWVLLALVAIGLLSLIISLSSLGVVPTAASYDKLKDYFIEKPSAPAIISPPPNPSTQPSSIENAGVVSHTPPPLIPKKVWQIFFSNNVKPDQVSLVPEWLIQASGYTYSMVGDDGAEIFIQRHYSPDVIEVFRGLKNVALKSDFLRYLILAVEGGYYGDLDAKPLLGLDDWIAEDLKPTVGLIIAPEYDDGYGTSPDLRSSVPYEVQFGQWCIAAAPGHPVLRRMVWRSIEGMRDIAAGQGKTLGTMEPVANQVLNATGPWAWSEILWKYILEEVNDPHVQSWKDLSQLVGPKLVGDVLVLPLSALRTPISDGEKEFFEANGMRRLIDHGMWGSWRGSTLPKYK